MIKTLNTLGLEENFFNMIKSVYERSAANILFNGGRQKGFPLQSETRQGCLLFVTSIQHSKGGFS